MTLPDNRPGVYKLLDADEVVYVGSSKSLRSRISSHPHRGLFDSVEWIYCAFEDLQKEEQRLIDEFAPRLNKCKTAARRKAYYSRERRRVQMHAVIDPRSIRLLDGLVSTLGKRFIRAMNRSDAVAYAIHLTAKKEGLL